MRRSVLTLKHLYSVGSSFTLVREDLAKKMAIACAIVWNLYMIVLHILCYFVMVLKMVRKGKVL